MKILKKQLALSKFYIEEEIINLSETKEIIKAFPDSEIILIKDYKDVFNRKNQSYARQKDYQAIILARKKENFLYSFSSNCLETYQKSFYMTQIINCPFDCDYCFLKGMYPSAYLLIFVNLKDFFEEIKKLEDYSFVSLSYETDFLALTQRFPMLLKEYLKLFESNPNITFEIRTKSLAIDKLENKENLLLSYSLLPKEIIEKHENRTPDLESRLDKIALLLKQGYKVRLALDPIIYIDNYQEIYQSFCEILKSRLDLREVFDIHIGFFRISKDYLKRAKANYPLSQIWQYPYNETAKNFLYRQDFINNVKEVFRKNLKEFKIYFQGEI